MNETSTVNAICLDGPYRGALVRVEQEVGVVVVPDPTGTTSSRASYRITRERVHHPSHHVPFIGLRWVAQD
ncbi:hypothetical protein [Actinomadura nitritigenes]|uniref:hypothetical protein n=1 Tax=Actinomadura nitritigenes TaxID=134602 RepID=UPI003D93A0D2